MAAVAGTVLLVAGLPTLAVALAAGDEPGSGAARHGQGWAKHFDKHPGNKAGHDKRSDKAAERGERHRDRPSWAHRQDKPHGPGAAWKALTPAQKAKKMAELSREHARGMQKWADCVAAGRDDCERPLPPGLAKRR